MRKLKPNRDQLGLDKLRKANAGLRDEIVVNKAEIMWLEEEIARQEALKRQLKAEVATLAANQ